MLSSADRFWSRVDRSGGSDSCWPWTGYKQSGRSGGYGIARLLGTRERLAHRIAWLLSGRDFGDGLVLCHRCDSPPCCNPAHLFTATQRENMADMQRKGRANNKAALARLAQAPELGPRGSRNGLAILDEQKVRSIKQALVSGVRPDVIAHEHGVVVGTIYNIAAGRSWRHVA